MMNRLLVKILTIVSGVVLVSCASSHIIVGTPRPPITPAMVKLYLAPPTKYEQIAIIEASSKNSWAVGSQAKMDKGIQRLKEEAASLGANGILLQGVGEQNAGAVGTSIGSATAYGAGNTATAYGTGLAISSSTSRKSGQGIAIYVIQE